MLMPKGQADLFAWIMSAHAALGMFWREATGEDFRSGTTALSFNL